MIVLFISDQNYYKMRLYILQRMYCLNQRIGILFRQNISKKSYELRYFFLDDESNLYYISNLPKLQKVIKVSSDVKQIKAKLVKQGERSLNLNNYNFSQPKIYSTEAVVPFCNRTYIEMKEKQTKEKDQKGTEKTPFMLLGFMDEDTIAIFDEIMHLTNRKKKQITKRKSVSVERKEQEIENKVFSSFVSCSDSFSMDRSKNKESSDNQYQGQKSEGIPQGKGKQILISKGITFSGSFRNGLKCGKGYLVNQNLDTLQCQFINDELSGI